MGGELRCELECETFRPGWRRSMISGASGYTASMKNIPSIWMAQSGMNWFSRSTKQLDRWGPTGYP